MNKPVFHTVKTSYALRISFCIGILICFFYFPVKAQKDTGVTLTEISVDTALVRPVKLRKAMEEHGERARKSNIQKYQEGRNAIRQAEIIGEIKRITLLTGEFVKTGIDTAAIWNEYRTIDSLFQIAGEGIFTKAGTIMTHRNLTISYRIIKVLLDKSENRKEEIDEYIKQLASYKFQLDSLSADSVLYELPSDSVTFNEYINTLFLTVAEIAPADSAIQKSNDNVRDLQVQLSIQVNELRSALDKIDNRHARLSATTFKRELVNLWEPAPYPRPLPEIIAFSKEKNLLALNYYAENNIGIIVFCILAIIALSILLRTLKKKLKNENELKPEFAGQIVFGYPVLSAIFIGLTLFQFLFPDPPFIFGLITWTITALCLTVIFWRHITNYWKWFWVSVSLLFIITGINNLILQSSRQERWWMVILAAIGALFGVYFILRGKRDELKEKGIVYFIGLMVVLEFFALFFNVTGRYNVSKTLLTLGYMSVILGIQFLWTARLLQGMIVVASRFYGRTERDLNFETEIYKVPFFYYLLLFSGWFILVARNIYSFRLITGPFQRMMVEEHSIGNYSFTVNNMLLFVAIIAISTFLSKIVSFFAAHKPGTIPDKYSRKSKMGSWILLIRIGIISCGLFLAAAAAGIPMDRITLIMGALGVGIGFGLQELTSSLISGIIIAFERPVNVGDIVEVADQSGTMKSIGFRSSVLTNMDGADVIIPNNTLLSSHLINWTMSDEKRRVGIEVQVLWGADLPQVKAILLELLNSDERILKYPPPTVEFTELKNSIVDIKIYFWLIQVQEWIYTRSDIIQEIDRLFEVHKVQMPLPPG